jgi:CheY-like chemotaxis protein
MPRNSDAPESPSRISALVGQSILIIEDEPLVALDVHSVLSAAGASVISATSAGEAIQLIGYAEVSAAIVDVQLGADDAAEVCRLLESRRIPFVFYTGRADVTFLRSQWPDIGVLKKPATRDQIVTALSLLLRLRTEK